MWRCFFLLCLFISDVCRSVDDSGVQQIISAVGGSVTFPINVMSSGTIAYEGAIIGQVFNKQSDTNNSEAFMNRLHWLRGFFTLSELTTEDSGRYTVQSLKDLKAIQNFQLEVFDRVSAPRVMSTTSNSSEFCSLLCSVKNLTLRGLTLSWYRDSVLLNHSSSSSSTVNTTLNLQLEVKKTDKHTYSCVASNPTSNQTTKISLYCPVNTAPGPVHSGKIVVAVVLCVVLVVAVIIMLVYLGKRQRGAAAARQTEDRSVTEGLNEGICYSLINYKPPPPPQVCISECASEEMCPLTTVYDQIRLERSAD